MTAIPGGCLCLVTDSRALSPDARTPRAAASALEAFLAEAIDAGIDVIQIRERGLDAGLALALTAATVARARGTTTRVLVNDRVDVAVAAGADGVHLRGDGPPASVVRRLVPENWLIGRSMHLPAEAAQHGDADYLLFGTVFESLSKPGQSAVGTTSLAEAVRRAAVPVLAIGGITPERARACVAAGASGVAAISLFLPPGRAPGSLGVAGAVRQLRAAIEAGC